MPIHKAKVKWIENVRTVVDNSRTHTVTCDLPKPKGGDDTGPTALELAIMSLADCAATIFADVCKQSKIQLSQLEVFVEAEKPPDSPKLTRASVRVKAFAKAREQLLKAAWRRTEANCPVVLIFQESIPLTITFEPTTQ